VKAMYPEITKAIREEKVISKDTEAALKKAIKEFKDTFATVDEVGA
jgi:F-type H+/Na+-transporting ATPase subunit alpha